MESGKAALKLIDRFGVKCSVKNKVKGAFNPELGEYEIDSTSNIDTTIVILSNTMSKSSRFYDTLDADTEKGEKKAYIKLNFVDLKSVIEYNGKEYRIIKKLEIEQKGEVLFNKIIISEIK